MKIVSDCGIKFARTVRERVDFTISENLLALKAARHHDQEDLFELIDRFVEMKPDSPKMLYIWEL